MNLDFLIFAHNNSFDTKILKLDGAHGAKLDFNLESNWILYFGFKYIYIYIKLDFNLESNWILYFGFKYIYIYIYIW